MSALVRRAGRATFPNGTEVVWSVADGRRGRRWRAVITHQGALVEALLLEVDRDGRPARLELTTAAGLLTLHPEAGSLHGNAVTRNGVRHLALAWSAEHELAIDALPIAAAVTAMRLAGSTAVGEGKSVPVVAIAPDLEAQAGFRRYLRIDQASWRIEGGSEPRTLTIDERGIPRWSDAAEEWPLELESQP